MDRRTPSWKLTGLVNVTVVSSASMVAASVGVSLFPADADSPRELLQHADAAMYRAKQHCKNTLRFYN